MRRPKRAEWKAAGICLMLLVGFVGAARCGEWSIDGKDSQVRWSVGHADADALIHVHDHAGPPSHRGIPSERVLFNGPQGRLLRLELPLPPAPVIDELRASVRVRGTVPGTRLGIRVVLPAPGSAHPAETPAVIVILSGDAVGEVNRWVTLRIADLPRKLQSRTPALRAEHGDQFDLREARATHLVLETTTAGAASELAIDDVRVDGILNLGSDAPHDDPNIRQTAMVIETPPAEPSAGLMRGVLEVGGQPFFPRAVDHRGEPLAMLAGLGCNCVRLSQPATAELLEEARQAKVWLIGPPPALPDVDVRDQSRLPTFSTSWDRVLLWDLGEGLTEADVAGLAEQVRRLRICDQMRGRATIAAADSGLRSISRHVDFLVARRTVLGTTLELNGYLDWLRERPRLSRPGTPLLATLSTELDPRAADQAVRLAGVGAQGLAVEEESLLLASLTALAGGSRGILYRSEHRLDGDDPSARRRALAIRTANQRLEPLTPWAAGGRFSAAAQSSDPDVQAFVIEAARARIVVVWRSTQAAQITARRFHGELPHDDPPLSLLIPGVPEAHQAWEVTASTLRPLRPRRVTGGVAVSIEDFQSHAIVLLSGEPAVVSHLQEQVRSLAPAALELSRTRAAAALSRCADLLARLPARAVGPLPTSTMLSEASREASAGDRLLVTDPASAEAHFARAVSIIGQYERLLWERGVLATGSLVASPLCVSTAMLPQHWQFIETIAATRPGPELLPGGTMEQIGELATHGWRHFFREEVAVQTTVELVYDRPAGGRASLALRSAPTESQQPPLVVETPPVWITTPPIQPPAGALVEITAQVWVPGPISGSVDGLLVFDSYGGPALAERVGTTEGWRRLQLYRMAPTAEEPLTLTFALTGLGEARIDDVSIRTLERTGATPVAAASTTPAPSEPFATPGDLLASPRALPPSGQPRIPLVKEPAGWPGIDLAWPNMLPFGRSSTAPPPGPGGGTIDPFRRARGPVSE